MSHLLMQANALHIPLASKSVQCCVTSPPYWSLRDYGVEGQLGLEATPDLFVANMMAVFREVWRVLRDDGTCWVNLGDSYSGSGPQVTGYNEPDRIKTGGACNGGARVKVGMTGLKPKDLIGIPWRVALALQADGWYLRSDIIWAKPNPMPESVTDRPTKSHEYVFLLTKSERYFWDAEAVREAHKEPGRIQHHGSGTRRDDLREFGRIDHNNGQSLYNPSGRNIRTVWNIPTESFPGSHFATYPRKLVEPCIKAGTSQRGACPECGKPWVREVESERVATRPAVQTKTKGYHTSVIGNRDPQRHMRIGSTTTGWRAQCQHDHVPVPCVVLDPFAGSGTTGVVAEGLHRNFVGLDLSREYLGMARNRIERPHKPIPRPGRVEHHPLFDRTNPCDSR